jgi:tryptophan synthase alpha chain
MNKIKNAFNGKKAFIGYVTGGDPNFEKSEEYILKMIDAGADLIEIGIPFSDPIAEGPVIQAANLRALAAGATVDKIFGLAEKIRRKSEVPLVFLTYLNPVLNYGYPIFFERCEKIGVDGIIIPDMPFEEQGELKPVAEKYNISVISLIAPTSEDRTTEIVKAASGFVYIVSSMGVTGVRSEITTDLHAIIDKIKSAGTIPAAVGFGIHTPDQAKKIAQYADGVIVGSAIVKIIEEHGENAGSAIYDYVSAMKKAIR